MTIYEQRSCPGLGVWDYPPPCRDEADLSIPSINPFTGLEKPHWTNGTPSFPTPMYDDLETNIPHSLMGFESLAFQSTVPLLPSRDQVTAYLSETTRFFWPYVRKETQATKVEPASKPSRSPSTWRVTSLHLPSGVESTESYDAVAICNGHYNVPHVPVIPGLGEWAAAYPGAITHSKSYRNAKPFASRKVLVVGTSASGTDIAAGISSVARHPVLVSRRRGTLQTATTKKLEVPTIASFLPPTITSHRAVRFADGRVEKDIDAVVFCTGYLYAFPFFPDPFVRTFLKDGQRVLGTYKHVFWQQNTSLVFIGLMRRVLPIPVAEAQAAVVARVWSGRLRIPEQEEMTEWERKRLTEAGNEKEFHVLIEGNDLDYCEELNAWAATAQGESDGRGLRARTWSKEEYWVRGLCPKIKKMWMGLGAEKLQVKTVEDLGLHFEKEAPRKVDIS